jgi:hypothetical protein
MANDKPTAREEGEVMSDGVYLIAEERSRQIAAEGWTADHDDDHCSGELVAAAICYASALGAKTQCPRFWPWDASWWKPRDEIRNLVKAGALISAEIDRLQRAAEKEQADAE